MNTPEVSSPIISPDSHDIDTIIGYTLPIRCNRGKPPNRYSLEVENRRSKYLIANFVSTTRLFEPLKNFAYALSSCHVPTGVHEALANPKWTQAIKDEMNALLKNETWTLALLPEAKEPMGCKSVFSIKHKADGSIERYKARLVTKCYTQTYGVDYQETFSPVAKLNTVRVLVSLAANLD